MAAGNERSLTFKNSTHLSSSLLTHSGHPEVTAPVPWQLASTSLTCTGRLNARNRIPNATWLRAKTGMPTGMGTGTAPDVVCATAADAVRGVAQQRHRRTLSAEGVLKLCPNTSLA